MKLCIGTVQFGMEYGIQKSGQPVQADALEMLDRAINNGVCAIDTAAAYGTAEYIVGKYIKNNYDVRDQVKIISKLAPDVLAGKQNEQYFMAMHDCINQSLNNLNTDYLDAYLFHNPAHLYYEEAISALFKLKDEGLVRKIGVSVYTPEEAKRGIECGLDVLQVPYSIFDQRMDEQGVFELALRKKVEIHSRSAFTQGLMLMDEADIPSGLNEMRSIVRTYSEFCTEAGLSRLEMAIAFINRQNCIEYLVFGVDRKEQLSELINATKKPVNQEVLIEAAKRFAGIDERLIIPSKWQN
jgi:aryl-alcohol dehydrogenase-like predicted oxidoreductase